MQKRKFSRAERYAVWKTLGPQCRWCNEPVEFEDCHIDHILPEKLLDDPADLAAVLKNYGLPDNFDINSFFNWVPAHPSCNQSKQAMVLTGAPVYLQLFTLTADAYPKTKRLHDKWVNQNKTAGLMMLIEQEARNKTIDKTTITRIFAQIDDNKEPVLGLTGSTINNQVFYVPSREVWTVVDTQGDHYVMEKDGRQGIAPVAETPDPEWLCHQCRSYGPWDGNECLVCGAVSYQ